MSAIQRLTEELGGDAFARSPGMKRLVRELPMVSARASELASMLEQKNGFFAFESALHV